MPGEVKTFVSPEDLTYLALTIWGEARGEGREGMRAVAHVIKNRRDSPNDRRYGSTIRQVCTKPWQFSCWNANDPNSKKLDPAKMEALNPATPDGNSWRVAKQIAYSVLAGVLPDITNGATYYHTKAVDPSWDDDMKLVATVGRHLFYVDV